MEKFLIINARLKIPREELTFTFVRSSGPGGQNVNKVNSKAVLRWPVKESQALPEDVRRRFESKFVQRINADGDLILTSQRYRDQPRNVDDCLEKLRAMLLAVATVPKKRRATRPTKASRERRLQEKRVVSDKKKQRRSRPSRDE